jgi:hypothetical protein
MATTMDPTSGEQPIHAGCRTQPAPTNRLARSGAAPAAGSQPSVGLPRFSPPTPTVRNGRRPMVAIEFPHAEGPRRALDRSAHRPHHRLASHRISAYRAAARLLPDRPSRRRRRTRSTAPRRHEARMDVTVRRRGGCDPWISNPITRETRQSVSVSISQAAPCLEWEQAAAPQPARPPGERAVSPHNGALAFFKRWRASTRSRCHRSC